MKKVKAIIYFIVTLLLALYVFFESVNLSPLYSEGAFFWAFVISLYILIFALFRFGEFSFGQINASGGAQKPFNYVSQHKFPKLVKILIAAPWAFFALMMILSSPLVSWGAYRDQLGNTEFKEFSSDVQAVDMSQVPIIDANLAYNLADKKLGEKPSLGSQVYLGVPTIQLVDGKLLWAVPLHHSGVFKWLTNLSGSAGYITVSATNMNDVNYIEDYKIKIQSNGYLMDDLARNIRFTLAPFTGLTDPSFELDDSGHPFWVVTTYKNKRGFALPEATGIIVVDATNGKKQTYLLPDVPEWVDRVQPEDSILNQINNQGVYVHGIFNFADKDKYKTSALDKIVYNNGDCYLFTGLTSVGQDESAIGFMMVDMVTKQPIRYQINGATEDYARRSAQGKVQHLGYVATEPLIINLEGQPTYFMTLKDKAGLIKQYAFVSVTNYSSVGVGETINDAMRDYTQVLRSDGSSSVFDKSNAVASVSGKVLRIAPEQSQSVVMYKIILENQKDRILIVDSVLSEELALTQAGDTVEIQYFDNGNSIVEATAFDNKEFNQSAASSASAGTDSSQPDQTQSVPPTATEPAAPNTAASGAAEPEDPAA